MVTVTKTKPKNRMAKKQSSNDKSSETAQAAKKDSAKSMLDANPHLKTTVAQIEKEFGEGAIMALGSEHAVDEVRLELTIRSRGNVQRAHRRLAGYADQRSRNTRANW